MEPRSIQEGIEKAMEKWIGSRWPKSRNKTQQGVAIRGVQSPGEVPPFRVGETPPTPHSVGRFSPIPPFGPSCPVLSCCLLVLCCPDFSYPSKVIFGMLGNALLFYKIHSTAQPPALMACCRSPSKNPPKVGSKPRRTASAAFNSAISQPQRTAPAASRL